MCVPLAEWLDRGFVKRNWLEKVETCLLRIIPIERVGRLCVERSPIPHADVFAVSACIVICAAAGELIVPASIVRESWRSPCC